MSGGSPILTKTFAVVDGTVPKPRRLVRQGAQDGAVNQAIGDTQPLLGVTAEIEAPGAGDPTPSGAAIRVDVHMAGIAEVECGGTVTRGDPLTSNGAGEAVDGTPAAGETAWVVGIALASGVDGDIIPVVLAPTA